MSKVLVDIEDAITRFLRWRLPKPWHPDNGISYVRPIFAHAPADHDWPTGTNLFDSIQTRVMLEEVLGNETDDGAGDDTKSVMRGALQIIAAKSTDRDMACIAQAALDLDKHGFDACAEMRGDKPE